jgi:hypothetical protein
VSYEVNQVAIVSENATEQAIAEPDDPLGDRIEYRLYICLQPIDDAQDLARRRLLLLRLGSRPRRQVHAVALENLCGCYTVRRTHRLSAGRRCLTEAAPPQRKTQRFLPTPRFRSRPALASTLLNRR